MEKLIENFRPFGFNFRKEPQLPDYSYSYRIAYPSLNSTLPQLEVLTYSIHEPDGISFDPWIVLSCILTLHLTRQIFLYYKFLTSEGIRPLWKYLSFFQHILPSFLLSVMSNVRVMNLGFLAQDISANAALKRIHMHPSRSTFHTFNTDVHGYEGATFLIVLDTDERVLAFRRVFLKFFSERFSAGLLPKIVSEGIQKWIKKETIDLLDIIMFLESVILRFLYDIDPDVVFTPEQRIARAKTIYAGAKWVLYDSYKPARQIFGWIFQATGVDLDPLRRRLSKALNGVIEGAFELQVEMMKRGERCLLGDILQDPELVKLDLNFIKANSIGSLLGGQFLTSISNTTGMLYNMSKGNGPTPENKLKWILQIISDWSPLSNILRSYQDFIVIIPSTGNAQDLNRSFSLGKRQCPGRALVLDGYGCVVDMLEKYNVSVENLNNTKIGCPWWPFVNKDLKFRIYQS